MHDLHILITCLFLIRDQVEVQGGSVTDDFEALVEYLADLNMGTLLTVDGFAACLHRHAHRELNRRDSKTLCYQCDRMVTWLAPDGRCKDCTGWTPGALRGEVE